MNTPTPTPAPSSSFSPPVPPVATVTPASSGALASSVASDSSAAVGATTIKDEVVAKVAGIAAREVVGVHDLGGGAARAIGAVRGMVNQADVTQGISVEVGETQVAVDVNLVETQVAVDVNLVAEYPLPLQDIADNVRGAVINAVEELVGLQVTEVNITISDIHVPSEDDDSDSGPDKASRTDAARGAAAGAGVR